MSAQPFVHKRAVLLVYVLDSKLVKWSPITVICVPSLPPPGPPAAAAAAAAASSPACSPGSPRCSCCARITNLIAAGPAGCLRSAASSPLASHLLAPSPAGRYPLPWQRRSSSTCLFVYGSSQSWTRQSGTVGCGSDPKPPACGGCRPQGSRPSGKRPPAVRCRSQLLLLS